jgi:hypothetical protein
MNFAEWVVSNALQPLKICLTPDQAFERYREEKWVANEEEPGGGEVEIISRRQCSFLV